MLLDSLYTRFDYSSQHWDTIQRIAISLQEKSTTQTTLVRKLSGYKKNHPLLRALNQPKRKLQLRF